MRKRLAICLSATAALLLVGGADAAMLKYGTLVLRADGGFQPHVLPRRAYAPISFQGFADIRTTDSSPPPALQHVRLSFDRDGRLTTAGLAVCAPAKIEGTAPAEARRRCEAAIVGRGHVSATITLPGQASVENDSALTIFNGLRQGGNPTVIAHASTTFPSFETYVVVVPIERRSGPYSYRLDFEVPAIAGGYGALTHIDLKIGKRYRFRGAERSYVSARCSDGILETHGRFTFVNGMVFAGPVEKPCRTRP